MKENYFSYKYNGKELQETGMYDYGWRQYMPDMGRWYGMDQLSEMYHSLSPYNYVANNPVNFVDPDGRCIKNEQGDLCDDYPGGANNPNLIEGVVVTGKKKTVQVEAIAETPVSSWGNLFGIGYLGMGSGSSGGGSSGIGGGWGPPGNGSMGGGGAPSPIKLRPVDDIEKQMNRKQQLEYERLQNSKIDDIATGLGINMNLKEGLADLAKKIANGNIGKSGENFLSVTKAIGKATGVVGAGIAWNDYYKNPTTGGLIKAILNTGLVFIRVNPFIGIGLGILDLSGGSDWFYNHVGNGIDNMKK